MWLAEDERCRGALDWGSRLGEASGGLSSRLDKAGGGLSSRLDKAGGGLGGRWWPGRSGGGPSGWSGGPGGGPGGPGGGPGSLPYPLLVSNAPKCLIEALADPLSHRVSNAVKALDDALATRLLDEGRLENTGGWGSCCGRAHSDSWASRGGCLICLPY